LKDKKTVWKILHLLSLAVSLPKSEKVSFLSLITTPLKTTSDLLDEIRSIGGLSNSEEAQILYNLSNIAFDERPLVLAQIPPITRGMTREQKADTISGFTSKDSEGRATFLESFKLIENRVDSTQAPEMIRKAALMPRKQGMLFNFLIGQNPNESWIRQ